MNKLLIICGPTATGKTVLAATLAKKFNGELISADSRQVYRGMDIGTGKDRPASVRVWLYDVVNPDEEFSVAHFQRLARSAIEDINKRGKLPIVVGGTGLYIKSLIEPMETINIPPNVSLRQALETLTLEQLQKKLQGFSMDAWNSMNQSDRRNPRRLIRKIEVFQHGYYGDNNYNNYKNYDFLILGLTAPLPILYERIDQRVEDRMKQGIVEEVQRLLDKGYTWDLPAMNTFGYIEWKDVHKNTDEIVQSWKYHEHAYARRQMTWFRKQKGIVWFDTTQVENVIKQVDVWYNMSV